MRFAVCINENHDGSVTVTETGCDYLADGSGLVAKNRFEYYDTAAVDVLTLNTTSGKVPGERKVTPRYLESTDATLTPDSDGWYTLAHIIIPTGRWLARQQDTNPEALGIYSDGIWYADGGSVYYFADGKTLLKGIDDLMEVIGQDTTVSRRDADWFRDAEMSSSVDALMAEWIVSRMGGATCKSDMCAAYALMHATSYAAHNVRINFLAEAQRVSERTMAWTGKRAVDRRTGLIDRRRDNGCGCL